MIPFAAILLDVAFAFYISSVIFERPKLKYWVIPFVIVSAAIVTGKITGFIP